MNIHNVLAKATSTEGTGASSGAGATTTATPSTAQAAKDAADRFLTLLVAQLQNQDPLNPLDNAQVTTQLAQISTVSGINQLNDTVAALGASLGVTQYLQAVGLVGHEVVIGGNDIELASGAASGGVELSGDADHVMVTISDEAGNVVRTMDVGATKTGIHYFDWDGKTDAGAAAKDGHYTFSVTATAAGKAVTFDTLMRTRVEGVVTSPTAGAMLQLAHGNQIPFTQIRAIH
jgi:flagellar basal-body rod modification protein FlgD